MVESPATEKAQATNLCEIISHANRFSRARFVIKGKMPSIHRPLFTAAIANIDRRIAVERNRLLGPLPDSELLPTAALIRALRAERDETQSRLEEDNF